MRVFVGKTQEMDMGFPSAIFKSEVFGELWLGPEGLEGDEQASPKIHGGAERALLQYPSIHYDWWKIRYPAKRDLFKPALFGENLSDNRWHEKNICIGDIFRWGDAVIQVSQPRSPCYKLSRRTGCDTLALAMQQNARCGWLYRVLQPGTVGAGMPFRFAERISSVTVHEVMSVMFGNETGSPSMRSGDWQRLAETEGLSARWRKTLFRRIESGQIESWDVRLTGQGI